jgi:anhydro-N-acetylmuramic acid kinase
MPDNYNVIGIMSGTSLDGLDIAYCKFKLFQGKWNYEIVKATTIPYSKIWKIKLSEAAKLNSSDFARLNSDYASFIGKNVNGFISENNLKVDFIASHGHTVLHQPDLKFTVQIGSGAVIAAMTSTTVVCDFRTTDIALEGQGAPLVPIGDELLFGNYDACLNIGGFANLSYRSKKRRVAYDICPANIVINYLARKEWRDYDHNGKMAENGVLLIDLMKNLGNLKYYNRKPPKSLGAEWLEESFFQLIDQYSASNNDLLRTVTEHVAIQIARSVKAGFSVNILATGGGVHNTFLIKRINSLLGFDLIIPSDLIVDYKEALIFAFLGVLRMRNEVNCIKSVTGATRDSCTGAIYSGR